MADRSWSAEYLQKQHEAIIWLLKQGIGINEIREMRWGRVDDSDKTLSVDREITFICYDRDNDLMKKEEYTKTFKIQLRGTECEWFFLKSKIPCPWMFTREKPKTWRKEGSKESLYSLSDIERICGKLLANRDTSALTDLDIFDNIELSKLNITKMKTKELADKAKVVV